MKKQRFLRVVGIFTVILLLAALVGPFLIPVPPAPGTVPAQQLADSDSQFIEINSLSVHVKTMGQGEPVFILLHGFGASLFSWHAVMEPFSQHGMVIAYDRPAFGLTERPMKWTGQNPYGPEGNVALLLGLMDHFGVRKAILVGNSAGGTLAMQFALQHPQRVQVLILVDPSVNESGIPAWVRILGKTPEIQHLTPLYIHSIQKSGLDVIRMAWHDPSRITQETWDGYTKLLKVDNWDKALMYFTLASHSTGLAESLKDFTVPILVISGNDDRIVPTASSVKLAGELPGAKLAIIQNAGHVPHEEQPAAFMQAVDAFLQTNP